MTIELLNIDCMAYMKDQPDNAFDLAIVDPPYGINADKAQNKAAESRKNAKAGSKAGRGWAEYKQTEWDSSPPDDNYFEELFRVSKTQIIWGGNYFPLIWSHSNSFIIWNKMQREFSLADGELAWYSETGKAMRIFDMSRGEALSNNKGRIHPTQKPVKLYDWLLSNYANQGDRILDTHLGSGSSAIAAHYGGFDFVGCELDKDYFKAACERFDLATAQETLF